MKCLFCDKPINKYTLYGIFIEEDFLCLDCRRKLMPKKRKTKIEDMSVEYFYDYDSIFKSILLQYKECYDEALKDVFLYKIDIYLRLKYWNYQIMYVPSSKSKLQERGFNHLRLIYRPLGLKEAKGLRMKEDLIQEGKTYIERKKMVSNYVYEGPKINKLLIVDDVITTGSSLLGVYKIMKGHTNSIKALVMAKTTK